MSSHSLYTHSTGDIERRQAGWVGACYQRGVGLWVWVLRIVGARADGVLGRLLLAVRWDSRPLPSASFAVNVVLQLRESKSMCLPHTKLLAGAPEARRAAAMSAAPCILCVHSSGGNHSPVNHSFTIYLQLSYVYPVAAR